MTTQQEVKLAQTPLGRIKLHCIALVCDRCFSWHFRGMLREFLPRVR